MLESILLLLLDSLAKKLFFVINVSEKSKLNSIYLSDCIRFFVVDN